MICLLPLMAIGSPARLWGIPMPLGRRGRTWAAMFGAGLAASMFSPFSIPAFALIDGIAGYIVLKRPRGETQRAIGLLFVAMLFIHVGFFTACWLQPGAQDFMGYALVNRYIGWLQLACLALWGSMNALGFAIRGRSDADHPPLAKDGF